MRTRSMVTVVASLGLAAAGCNKKAADGTATKVGSGSAIAAGSGSAGSGSAAATGSGSATTPTKLLSGTELAAAYATCWEHFNTAAWNEYGQCYAEDATSVWLDSVDGMPPRAGRAQIAEHGANFKTGFPDAKGALQLVLVKDRQIAAMVLTTATNSGVMKTPMGPMPPSGKAVGQLMVHLVTYDDHNLIAKEEWMQDQATFIAQLGMSPQPGRPVTTTSITGAPIVVVAGGQPSEARSEANNTAMTEAMNKRDVTALIALFTPDAVEADQTVPADVTGSAAIEAGIKGFLGAFSDGKMTTTSQFGAGDYLFARSEFTGTHDGALGPIKATGKPVKMTVLEFARYQDGKAALVWRFYNMAAMAQQLGLMPPMGADEGPPDHGGSAPILDEGKLGPRPKPAKPADTGAKDPYKLPPPATDGAPQLKPMPM